jgi:hypothetical protein
LSARSCSCELNELPVPAPRPKSGYESHRIGRDRLEPSDRSSVMHASHRADLYHAGLAHSAFASSFPTTLSNVRLLI